MSHLRARCESTLSGRIMTLLTDSCSTYTGNDKHIQWALPLASLGRTFTVLSCRITSGSQINQQEGCS
jgi:hypothetical protein